MLSILRGIAVALLVTLSACAGTNPESNPYSNRLMAPTEVVREHFRAMEKGEWAKAETYLSEKFKLKVKGVPLSTGKKSALDFHKALFKAFPDLKFNEEVLKEDRNSVEMRIRITGTHLGTFDPPDANTETLPATGKTINLPYQTSKYHIRFNQIERISGEVIQGLDLNLLRDQLKSSE